MKELIHSDFKNCHYHLLFMPVVVGFLGFPLVAYEMYYMHLN